MKPFKEMLMQFLELTFGNKIKLLGNGASYQRKMLEIKNAKKSVLIAVMSFFCDESSPGA